MRVVSAKIALSTLLFAAAPCLALAPVKPPAPPANLKHNHPATRQPTQGMDPARATQIQTALIKAGYLTGAPTGIWDADSIAAMQKLQSDNGWQTKIIPDSRALILLGLGPQQDTPPTPTARPQ